jgi:hypothetical protein
LLEIRIRKGGGQVAHADADAYASAIGISRREQEEMADAFAA